MGNDASRNHPMRAPDCGGPPCREVGHPISRSLCAWLPVPTAGGLLWRGCTGTAGRTRLQSAAWPERRGSWRHDVIDGVGSMPVVGLGGSPVPSTRGARRGPVDEPSTRRRQRRVRDGTPSDAGAGLSRSSTTATTRPCADRRAGWWRVCAPHRLAAPHRSDPGLPPDRRGGGVAARSTTRTAGWRRRGTGRKEGARLECRCRRR